MKILLFGKDGQVGWELQRSLAPLGALVALNRDDKDCCGDLTDPHGIARSVQTIAPDVIVNAAAYTAVDDAESEADLADNINVVAPEILAREAQKLGALLVHYSTDYVFNGGGSSPWRETNVPEPLNVYGASKLKGEQAIQQSDCRHMIFRTSWVYAARRPNFAKTILRLAAERDELSVINDQIGAPTGAELIADVTAHAVVTARQQPQVFGLYHLVAAGETSWYGYARYVVEIARHAGMDVKVAAEAIRPVRSDAFQQLARRPKNSRLDTSKFRATFSLHLPDWQSGVQRMINEILAARS